MNTEQLKNYKGETIVIDDNIRLLTIEK
jgi:hypothetical protein